MKPDKNRNDTILKSFAVWLKNQGLKNPYIYTSGITKVNEEFFMPVRHRDMFEELPEAIRRLEAVDWLTSLESFINLALEKTVIRQDSDGLGRGVGATLKTLDPKENKKLIDRRTILRKFIEYVKFLQENQDDEDIFPSLDNSVTFLSKEELRKVPIYHSCISKGSDLFFLPTVLEKIFKFFSREEIYTVVKKKKLYWGDNRDLTPIARYAEWRENTLKATRVYTGNRIFWFNQIEGILLDKGSKKVMVVAKGHKYELFSILSEKTYPKKSSFRPKVEANKPIGEILQKHASLFPTMRMLTDMVHKIVNGAVLDITDKNGETKSIQLDEYRGEDFMHLKKYILQNLPAHKVMVLMPHFLMELYQLNEYISPRLIVKS